MTLSWHLVDIGPILEASLLFSLFAFMPGYVFGWLADLFEFRRATLLRQTALSVPLSVSLLPIVVYWPWRFLSVTAVWCVMAAIWIAFAIVVCSRLRKVQIGNRAAWLVALSAATCWTLVMLGSLPDLRLDKPDGDERLYHSVTQFDYLARVPIASQMSRQAKLPPQTPFLTAGRFVPLRYHYFWPMICGLAKSMAGDRLTARQCLMAGTLWAGFALLAAIALYMRFFQDTQLTRIRAYAVALAMLGVTGLDILPVLQLDYQWRAYPEYFPNSVEWWNDQVTGWVDAMLWVPHHIAALVAGMLAFLILWRAVESPAPPPVRWQTPRAIVLAALCLGSVAGLSIYLALVFALILMVWAVGSAATRHLKPLTIVGAAGALSFFLAAPFLAELVAVAGTPTGPPLLTISVREFGLLRDQLAIFGLIGTPMPRYGGIWRLVFLPLNYFMELGVFLIAGIIYWRRRKLDPHPRRDLAAALIVVTSVVIATFLRSQNDTGNDLGWRSFMPAQFILLLWTAEIFTSAWQSLSGPRSRMLAILLAIGVSSTLFDLFLLRYMPLFRDSQLLYQMSGRPVVDRHYGNRNQALAETYAWIRRNTPPRAVVQPNPDAIPAYHDGLFAERPALAIGAECGGYSNEKDACLAIRRDLRPVFGGFAPVAGEFAGTCRKYPVNMLIFEIADDVWNHTDSWIWKEKPVFQTPMTRVFACPVR